MLTDNVALSATRSISVAAGVTIDSGATLTLDGGRLTTSSIDNTNDGNFNFNSGDLVLTKDVVVGAAGPLGNTVTLLNDRRLILANYNYVYEYDSAGKFTGINPVDMSLTVDTGASFTLDGGTLVAGSVSNNGDFAFNSGVLGLTWDGLTVGAGGLLGSSVELAADRKLQVGFGSGLRRGTVDNSAAIDNRIDALSSGSNSLVIEGGRVDVSDGGLLTVSGDISNSGDINIASGGQVVVSGNVVHDNGTVDIAAGGELTIQSGEGNSYTQTYYYKKTNVDGVLNADNVYILGGELTGSGTINGNLTIDGGEYNPGNSPGTMTIVGDFVLTEAGTLHLEAALDANGNLAWDELIVGGVYDFQQNGTIQFSLVDGVDINSFGTDFTMANFFRTGTSDENTAVDLSPTSTIFDSVDLIAYDSTGSGWYSLAFDESGVFAASAIAPPPSSVVPVPAAVWLFGSGLIGLFGVAKRRKAS